jgi:hypothetical protein
MKAEYAPVLREMGVLADKPHCAEVMRIRYNLYHYNGIARRLKAWKHPEARKYEIWTDHFAEQLRIHLQGCEACEEYNEGILGVLIV